MKKSQPSNNNDEAIKHIENIIGLTNQAKHTEALKELNERDEEYSSSLVYLLNKSSLLINIGTDLQDIDVVEGGILAGEACLDDARFKNHRGDLLYNIANGLHFRITSFFHKNSTYFGIEKDIKRCADMFRESFQLTGQENAAVNLGNLYDETGRPLEAIIEYEKAIRKNSNFGMAYGNKALAIKRLSPISDYQGAYLIYAYQLLGKALDNKQSVISHGGQQAVVSFTQSQNQIKTAFESQAKVDLLDTDLTHHTFDEDKMEADEVSYTKFCLDNDLYLNLHMFDRHSASSIGDNISSSFITGINDEVADQQVKESFMRLNEIKESYITGRYTLWLSQQKTTSLSNISQQSLFVNNLDYTAHNIYTGLLKSAYKEGFSTLDKIANVINHYLELGHDEEKTNYRKIWFTKLDKKKGQINPVIQSQNYLLFGLYSIMSELGDGPDKIRNRLEHRYFRISTMGGDEHGAPTFDELTEQTIESYYGLKCAIVYLLNFLNLCEETKRQEAVKNGGIIPSMPVVTDQWLDLWQ